MMSEHNPPWKPQYRLEDVEVLLEDTWEIGDGENERSVKVTIGRPVSFSDPKSGKELFACPFFIEGKTERVVTAVGLGPLNALMSACVAIREIFKRG
jgi:hypothetical protein